MTEPKHDHGLPDTGEPPADEPIGKPSEEEVDPEEEAPESPLVDIRPIPAPIV